MINYNPQKIESKWRKIWEKKKIFEIDLKKAKKPYYNLMMFPYPSAEGLHVGNVYAFTGSDIYGRLKRMQGNDVFEPIGFDAFGIHSENFAIQKGIHPKLLIRKNVDNFRRQLKSLGCLFDWRYEVDTTSPNYYKWTQWLFLQLFKAGLAYRKKAPVDWCSSCKTVLADEQVINGKCERCDSQVIQKEMEQWFFRITKYAERLLKNLKWIDWSEQTKAAQNNWIGKSIGTEINFKLENSEAKISVFTTRVDTLFSGTFLILAPEHALVKKITNLKQSKAVERYVARAARKNEVERTELQKQKTGVFTGAYAVNPASNEKIPIWISDFVLAGYGTGAVFADAHDQRDFEMAKKYSIPLKVSLRPKDERLWKKVRKLEVCYVDDGILVNSGQFDGLTSAEARIKITEWLNKKGAGRKRVSYHLRDWLISRQRYWGPPIPIVYCKKCGTVPVSEKDLPVLLPALKNFKPTGTGKSPLASVEKFINVKCPKCKGSAQRETDVSDTFLDSAWYFFRYPSAKSKNKAFDKNLIKKWLPVDMYIGGQEHAVLHLMYSRFITMALRDLGFINIEEPFKKFRAHGLLTKEGAKMSKSKGNVVNPDDYYKKYGADTLRTYLMFLGPFIQGGDWQDKGIIGIKRFLNKAWNLQTKLKPQAPELSKEAKGQEEDLSSSPKNPKMEVLVQKTIKKVTEDIEGLKYNTAISALMVLTNGLAKEKELSVKYYQLLIALLSPFAPYLAEELWQKAGGKDSIHNQKWPKYDSRLTKEKKVILVIQVNGKIRDKVEVEANISEEKAKELAISREKIKNRLLDKKVKKVIFIPGKLINIVTK